MNKIGMLVTPETETAVDIKKCKNTATLNRVLIGLVPFTPVKFTGPDKFLAWGRIIGYGVLSYWTYNKIRPVAYGCMVAAGLSLATSLTAGIWEK